MVGTPLVRPVRAASMSILWEPPLYDVDCDEREQRSIIRGKDREREERERGQEEERGRERER